MGKSLNGKELGEGITQRPDGRYQARYTDRFGKRKYVYDNDLKKLKQKLICAKATDYNGLSVCDVKTTMDDWFETYLITYNQGCNSTQSTYRTYYNRVKKEIGHIPVSKLKLPILQNAINQINSGNSQEQTLSLLKLILDTAVKCEMVPKNIADRVTLTKKKEKKPPRVLTPEETGLFMKEAENTARYPIFVVAYGTGMRIGEVHGLKWEDVDFKKNQIHVQRTLCIVKGNEKTIFDEHPTKTSSGKRTIPMRQDVKIILKQQFEIDQQIRKVGNEPLEGFENLVFVTENNHPVDMSSSRKTIKTIVKKINKEHPELNFKSFSPHAFRHTFATRAIETGMKPKTLQKILGHSSLRMTMDLYCHVTEDTIEAEMRKMEHLALSM